TFACSDAGDQHCILAFPTRRASDLEGYTWSWNRSTNRLAKEEQIKRDRRGGYWGQRFDDSKGEPVESPDKTQIAYIKNSNIYVAMKADPESERQLTFDGSPGEYYSAHLHWSPDGRQLAGSKVRIAEVRVLTLLESSP